MTDGRKENPLDVALIQPPTGSYRRDDRCQSRVEDQTIQVSFPPMDLAYHAAVLERAGYSCAIRDYSTARISPETALAEIASLRPETVFFSSTQPTQANDLAFAKKLKETDSSLRIVLRGESVTFQDTAILSRHPQVDLILRGESEETLLEVLDLFSGKTEGSLGEIPGVTFRRGSEIERSADRPFIKDLDDLPWPARNLLDRTLYRSPETGNVLTTLYAARGCPYPCIFCPAPLASGRPVRLRTPEDLTAEVRHCLEEYGIREFLFHGDTFTYSRKWVLDLCSRIVEAGLRIRWGCNSRVDTIDPDMLAVMKSAGCWVIGFGVESGHEETLRLTRKAIRREQIVSAFEMCRKAGIRSHAFFVFGFPWEGPEHLEEDYRLALEIDPDFFDLNIAYPLPGTELMQTLERSGRLESTSIDQGGYAVPTSATEKGLTPEDLERWRRKTLLALYLRPNYIYRTLRQAGSPWKAMNYVRAGAVRLFQLAAPRVSHRPPAGESVADLDAGPPPRPRPTNA